ncbi:NADP-dependent isocitrate dehydrogenase [Chloroflexota bacterium]|nr:NADP-dependent isocitrate dehydrogenase [Chloroflexota bacterium]
MASPFFTLPPNGESIILENGKLQIPDHPIIPFIEGDGVGPDIWQAARPVLDEAVRLAYAGKRSLAWMEIPAGGKALAQLGTPLPPETVKAIARYHVAIKGPLTTPVGQGFRSLNVALRRGLDLFACVRPVRWIPGVPTPVRQPELVNMVIFRENTEDIYAGIEFQAGSEVNAAFQAWLANNQPEEFAKIRFPESSAFSIKPISRQGSERLIRAAINYALEHGRKRVTLVHKGNIMKFTEGAFASWGYDLAEREFGDQVYTQRQFNQTQSSLGEEAAEAELQATLAAGKIHVNDVITDAAFEQALTRPASFDVIATMNLNGDYLSDALTAQVGGLGMAPGANLNYDTQTALFEATHGTAPTLAGKNQANPSSLILSGQLMLRYLGWHKAANLVEKGLTAAIAAKTVTADLQRLMPEAETLSTSAFGQAVINQMQSL